MKKKILVFVMIIAMLFCFAGCSASSTVESVDGNEQKSMFIEVECSPSWRVVYHKDTKVMYTVSRSSSNYGNFTLLVNPDGTPMLYEE